MFTWEKLSKLVGIRKTSDFSNPKIGNSIEIEMPINSALLWFHKEYIGNPLFKKLKSKPKVLVLDKYYSEGVGKYRRLSVDKASLVQKMKKLDVDKDFEFITSTKKLFLTNKNTPIIFDFFRLNYIYKYEKYRSSEYDQHMNSLRTVLDASIEPDRVTSRNLYITVPIPKVIPDIANIKRALKVNSYKTLDLALSTDMLIILELIKLLSLETINDSIFSRIPKIAECDIKLIFGLNGKISVCSLPDLLALSKDNDVPLSKIKGIGSSTAFKLFMKYIITITTKSAKSLVELEKDTGTDVSITGAEEEDIDTLIEAHNERQKEVSPENNVINKQASETLEDKFNKTTSISTDAIDVLQAKLDNKEISKKHFEKAIVLLKAVETSEKENTLTEKDIKLNTEVYPDDVSILDKEMLKSTNKTFTRQYLKKGYTQHQTRVFNKFGAIGLIPVNHEITHTEDIAYSTDTHKMTYLNNKGREIALNIIIPKVDKDGKMKINNNEYILYKQKADLPIKKIGYDTVALNSYYSKIFISKASSANVDLSKAIYKQLRSKLDDDNSKLSLLIFGKSSTKSIRLPQIYQVIGRTINSFTFNNVAFRFDYKNIKDNFKSPYKDSYGTIVAQKGKDTYYIDKHNDLIKVNTKVENLGKFLTYIELDFTKLPVEFASMTIMGIKIPLILILSHYDGISNVLDTLNVKYTTHDAKERITPDDNDHYVVRFKDVKLLIKSDWYDVVVAGLLKIKDLKYYDFESLNHEVGVNDIFNNSGLNSKRLTTELNLLKRLWVDPMTEDLLKRIKEPITFIGLLYRSAKLLEDDYHTSQNDVSGLVIKGYDRINGMLYNIMAKAVRDNEHKIGSVRTKVTMNPYELLSMLAEDGTFTLVDELNPFTRIKQDENVTLIGKFGRNKGSIASKDRVYDASSIGIISEATKDSGEVGVTTYLSASPKIDNMFGTLTEPDDNISIANKVSSSMLFHAGSDTDDNKRALYISVQNGSVVPTNSQIIWPVSTGYDYIIPYRMDDKFIFYVKEDATVIKITKTSVTIQYKSGKKETLKLKTWVTKDNGGLAYKHILKTSLTAGDKLKPFDIVYYDEAFFGPDIFDRRRIVYKGGDMALVALDETQETYEDSGAISREFSNRFSTNITKFISITIPADSNLKYIHELGTKISFNETLVTFINANGFDEKLDNKKGQGIIDDLKNNSIRSEAKGMLFKLEVFYSCELEDMSKSIRTLVENSDARLKTDTGFTGKVDNRYSVNAKPLDTGEIEIKFYIEKTNNMNVGDKAILANQLKTTIGEIFDKIVTHDGRSIDFKTSDRSLGARIVNSPEDIGSTASIMIAATKEAIAKYKI